MILVTLDSFVGKYVLARTNSTDPELQDFIDTYEKKYIYQLLGVELGQLLIDELTAYNSGSDPVEARFQVLLDPFTLQSSSCFPFHTGKIYESLGLKDMLTAFIYYHYVKETHQKHSQSGVEQDDAETAKIVNNRTAARFAERKWNAALDTVDAIQWRCKFYEPTVYPEYKGLKFSPQYGSLL